MPTSSAPSPEALAEDLYAYLPPAPSVVREVRQDAVLDASPWPDPTFSHATRVREPDVDAVRAWFRGRGREDFTWWLGPSTRPTELRERLLADGAEPHLELTAMVATDPPPAVEGVEVRRVETFEDYLAARGIGWEVWETPPERRGDPRERWEARSEEDGEFHLALVDGRPAGSGFAIATPVALALGGASVLPWARGRGAYRALVRDRWDAAVARGTPALAVTAMESSRPILERSGFRTVCTIELLRDAT